MSSSNFIVSPDDAPTRRRRRRDDVIEAEPVDEAEVITQLNSLETNARSILMDTSNNRVNTLNFLAQQSSVAKKILASANNQEDRVRLGLVESMELLRMMGDLYENKFFVIPEEEGTTND